MTSTNRFNVFSEKSNRSIEKLLKLANKKEFELATQELKQQLKNINNNTFQAKM